MQQGKKKYETTKVNDQIKKQTPRFNNEINQIEFIRLQS